MFRFLLIGLGILLVVASGVCQGLFTGRWGQSQELAEAARRLQSVPMTVGDWKGEQESTISDRALQIGEIVSYLSRRYVRSDGSAVNVLIVCGRPGPISVHTPDVCFRGAGFRPVSITHRVIAGDDSSTVGEAWGSDFSKQTPAAEEHVRVFWSWGRPSTWQAPDQPRRAFAGIPYLYKLYVVRRIPQVGESIDEDPCLEFMQTFLPQLTSLLFAQRT